VTSHETPAAHQGAADQPIGSVQDNAGNLATSAPTESPSMSRWSDLLAVAWLIVAAIALLVPALSHGSSLGPYDWLDRYGLSKVTGAVIHDLHGDQILQMIPWTQLAWTQVHQGHLPLWNSYSALGTPLAFNWQSATFSVPTLISYLVPVRLAFTVQVLVTLVTAGTGAYVLARILKMDVLGCALAGTVFELSGAFVFWLGWPIGSVLSWSGWLFAAVLLIMRGRSRWRNIVFFAVALACAVYAGQPDALTLLLLAVLIFAASSLILRWPLLGGSGPILRPFVDLVVAGLAGSALAAPLILPGYQVASTAIRTFQGSTFKRQVAWPVGDIGHLMFQGLNGVPTDFSPLYLGAIVVVLAITGLWWRRRQPAVRALVIVGLVMGIIAFVQPVENVLHQIPGLQAVRWYRSVVLMVLSVSVLAGLGTDALVRSFRVRWVRRLLAIGFAVAAGLLVIVWASGSRKLSLADAWTRTVGFRWSIFEVLIGLLGVGALFVVGKRTKPGDVTADGVARIVGAAFLVCATVFLVATGAPLWHSTSSYATPTPAEKTLQSAVGSSLVGLGAKKCFLPPGIGIHPNANILFGVHELAVYDPMLPRAYFKSWTEVTGQKLDSAGYPLVSFYCPGITTAAIARVYGVGFVLEPHNGRGPTGSVFVKKIGNELLFRIPGAAQATLTPLSRGQQPGVLATGTTLPVSHPDPASWKLVTNASTTQELRLRLTDVPGWHATIDGRPLALINFAGVMIEATIPPGRHLIQLQYWPDTFTVGIGLAVVAVVVLALGLVLTERRRKRVRPVEGIIVPTEG
jgi:hypothetical protein